MLTNRIARMSRKKSQFEELLPIELKLRLLEAEMERLASDAHWIEQRRKELQEEIVYFQNQLHEKRRRSVLRRVK